MKPPSVYILSSEAGEVGGAARATLLLCESLADSGSKVKLFVTLPPMEKTVRRLASVGVSVVTVFGDWSKRYLRGWQWGVPQRLIALRVALSARRHRPGAIMVMSLGPEARHLLRLPVTAPIITWETTEALLHVNFVDRKIHRYLHKASAVLVPSRAIGKNVRETYRYEGPIRTLPFWAEAPEFRTEPQIVQHKSNFLFLGRLSMDKGLDDLLQAFTALRDRNPAATLTICGGGVTEASRRLFEGNPAICFRGYVDEEEYETQMRGCAALVLPSLHEGYPLTLLEACARGKPVIATQVGSIPEVFANRQCALLVPPKNPALLADAMEQLLSEGKAIYQSRCLDAIKLFAELNHPDVVRARLQAVLAAQ